MGNPDSEHKCHIKLVGDGVVEETDLIINTRCLHLLAAGDRDDAQPAEPEPEPRDIPIVAAEESQCSTTLVRYGESHEPRQSIKPMVWHSAEQQAVFERQWVLTVKAHDPWELQRAKNDLWAIVLGKQHGNSSPGR